MTSLSQRARQHLAFTVARGAMRLPPAIHRAIAGAPIQRDGYTLDPALQFMLAVDPRANKPWPEEALRLRKGQDRNLIAARGPLPHVFAVKDLSVDGPAGALPARLYSSSSATAPLLVFFHGGGFVFGNLETHDVGCRLLCKHGAFNVLSVEYRLVPEHRFPAAIADAKAAFQWAFDHAKDLGADPQSIGVGGDSAGANLSAIVSQERDATRARPVCRILIYPPTDRTREHPSMSTLATGFLLTRASIAWFHEQYAGVVGADSRDPRVSPVMAEDLSGLPPALVVTAGFDPLRDEGEAYAAALRAAGTTAPLMRFDGLIHGFFNLTAVHEPSRDAVIAIAGATRALLERRLPHS